MKKIGLVCVTNHNFGSILQTYALQESVKNMGCSPQIMLYAEPKLAKLKRMLNLEYTITRMRKVYKLFLMNIFHQSQKNNLVLRFNAFKRFIDEELIFGDKCSSQIQLTESCEKYDAILLGSDQVWHPMNLKMDYFTLNFVPDGKKKGAYAPSFGVTKIAEGDKKAYKKYIERFDMLSCREKSGVQLVKDIIGIDAKLVCDPTLLLNSNDWINIVADDKALSCSIPDEKYIFCYFIGNNPNQRRLVRELADKTGLKVVALLHINEYIASDEKYADYAPYNVGPLEFLKLLKESEYVMTDSFHASVFALQFHKMFYTFDRFENGKGHSTTSRIDNLLSIVNLKTRKVPHSATVYDLTKIPRINYENVDACLESIREDSKEFLKSFLEQ